MRDDDFSERLHRSADFSGFTPLHYAALADSLECIRLLVNAGEPVKIPIFLHLKASHTCNEPVIPVINLPKASSIPILVYAVLQAVQVV